MSEELQFICRKCGEEYSLQEYRKSRFCRSCGTFLMSRKWLKANTISKDKMKVGDSEIKRFFPYREFRPHQKKAILFAYSVIRDGRIGLLSSPCGTGKSVSVLTAYFMARQQDESVGRLLALTRTRSQLEIYCRELKKIKESSNVSFTASIFKSKREMCPQIMEDERLREISYRDFLHYCRSLREGKTGDVCEYYRKTVHRWKPSSYAYKIINKIRRLGPLLPDEVNKICYDSSLCPYEITRLLARYADVIVGNYNYILSEPVRNAVLRKTGIKLGEVNCVFDEAHSLPRYASNLFSDELSATSVRRALKEAENYGCSSYEFLDALLNVIERFGDEAYRLVGSDEELLIDPSQVTNNIMRELNLDSKAVYETIYNLALEGERIRHRKMEEGRSPISYLSRCADFIEKWIYRKGPRYVHYAKTVINREGKINSRIGLRCLDPALAAGVINDLRSAFLMSGTLWHKDYYIDVLGLDRGRCEELDLPSPFPTENRLILVDKSVTTKFERRNEQQWEKIASNLKQIFDAVPGRVAVYFPSYEVMNSILGHLTLNRPVMVEGRETKIASVLNFLESNKDSIVFGVARGKISEGVDMSIEGRSMLSAVVIVGLPYPKNTGIQKALLKYFEDKFGERALEYANIVPCLNAMAQSAGRLLRSPEDRGVIIIMDGRAVGNFKVNLPKDWKNDLKVHLKISKLSENVADFLKNR